MKSFSLSNKKNIVIYVVVLLVAALILWFTFKPSNKKSCPRTQSNILVPIGNGKSVSLTKEQYQKLVQNSNNTRKEGFYVSSSDYIPSVQTENEYSSMLSLYKPKEQNRIIPEPAPVPVPVPVISGSATGATGTNGPVEGYGNVFLDKSSL